MLTVGVGVASLGVFSGAAGVGAQTTITNSGNNNGNTTQSNSASTSGACSPIQQQNNRDITNSNTVSGGNGGNGGTGGSGGSSVNTNIPIASPGTGNGNSAGGNGGNGGNGGSAHGSANAGNQVQIVSNCGNTVVSPTRTVVVTRQQVVTRTVTVQARAAAPVTTSAHFTG
jgi:hypothetical protein